MVKQLCAVMVLVFVVGSSLSASQTSDWVKVSPLGGGFSISMPAKPEEKTSTENDFSMHLFSLLTDKTVYIAEYGDYAPSIRLNIPGELAANRDNFVKGIDGRLIESKDITLNNRPGLEFTAESSQVSAKCRVYLFGNRVWMTAAAVFTGKTDAENVDRFLASFAFTDSSHPKP